MIKPINGYVVIEPVKHEEFMASQNTTYDEIGIVVLVSDDLEIKLPSRNNREFFATCPFKIGDKVYFDSWMVSKFPKGDNEYYWMVPFDNIKGYESND